MSNGWGEPLSGSASNSNDNGSFSRYDDGQNAQRYNGDQFRSGPSDSYRNPPQNRQTSMAQESGSGWQTSAASDQNAAPKHWSEPSAMERQEPRYEPDNAPLCQNYLAGRCNHGASCRYRHQLPDSGNIPQAREVNDAGSYQRSGSIVSHANAVPIRDHRSSTVGQYQDRPTSQSDSHYQQSDQRQGSSNGWNMQRREPAGWGNPPQDNQGMQGQDNGGWPAPRNLSTGYVAPIGHRDGPSSSTAYSAPAQQQSSGRQIADNAPPDGGRGWFGEGRQSSRFSDPIQDHYSAAAAKLQPTNQSTSAGSGWQTISSDEHEARSAVSRKSSRYDPKPAQDQTQSHNEPVPPLPDLPIARPASQQVSQPAIPRPQSRQQYRAIQEDSQNAYQQPAAATQSQSQPQPSSGASNPDHSEPPQQVAASGWTTIGPAVSNGSMQPDRASSQFHAQSNAEPGRVLQSSPISATRDRIDSVPAGATVRHGLPGSSRPEPDEVWVLKDYNAMRNNMWSPTLRSPRVPSHNAEQVSSSTQSESVLVSLDDYKQSSSARAEANGAADHGSRDGAPLVPNHGTEGKENSDQSFMSVAGESIRPSESASNVGGSVASDDDNRTMRSPSRSMHPQEAPRNGKFRAFCSHNSDSDDRTGSSSPKSTFEDNPNAMTTGWDPTPAKPAMPPQQSAASQPNESANRKQEVSHSFSRELPHQQQEAKREQKQPYDNGWQSTGHQSQSGWNTAAAQAPLPAPAPTPRQSSSASYAAVNELERAATPRAARSTVSAMSRHYDAHPHSHAQPAAERSATPGISIKGASKFHAESVDLKDQLAQAQEKIAKYERRLAMSQEELESQRIQALMAENRRLKERIAIMEAERSAVKSALVPALKILSTSGAPRQPSSSLTANGMQNQDAEVAALPRIKQETPPSAVNGWN